MILNVARTALIALRRDRGALVLSFVLPLAFFSIFAVIFGRQSNSTPTVKLIVVDEDRSEASQDLVKGLESESSLVVMTKPAAGKKNAPPPADYTAATAEAAVKAGDAPVALIIPKGFGQHPMAFGRNEDGSPIELLNDQSDTIAPQIVVGLLQKAAMTSMPASMAEEGMKYAGEYIGGFTPAQRAKVEADLEALRKEEADGKTGTASGSNAEGDECGDCPREDARGSGREQEEPDDFVLCGGDRRHVSAVHGERIGGSAAGRGGERDAGAGAEHARDDDEAAGGKAGVQHAAGVCATGGDVSVGMGGVQAGLLQPSAGVRGDGAVHGVCGGGVWDAAGQRVPDAGAAGRAVDAGDSDYVVGGRQHVSAVPDAGGDAEGGIADDQCVGDRRVHEGVLAGFAGDGFVAAGECTGGGGRGAVCDCAQSGAAVGDCVKPVVSGGNEDISTGQKLKHDRQEVASGGANTNELELTERLKLIESMIAEGRRSTRRMGLDVCAVGRGVLRGGGLGDVGQERAGVAGDDGCRGAGVVGGRVAHVARAAGDDAGPGDWRGVDRRWGVR